MMPAGLACEHDGAGMTSDGGQSGLAQRGGLLATNSDGAPPLRWLGVTAAAKANLRECGEHEQEKAEAKLFPPLARVERGRNEDLFVGCSRRQRR